MKKNKKTKMVTRMNMDDFYQNPGYTLMNDYHRKQSALLVKEIAKQPPMSSEECVAQAARHRRQTSEHLQKNVVLTEPVSGLVQWSMWSKAPENSFGLGHGIHYHDSFRDSDHDIVAFIRGFRWKHCPGTTAHGYYIQPDAITPAEVIAELKGKIEELLAAREQHYYPATWITGRFCARGNC